MDRTALFKATVKTIRTKNKALVLKDASRDILNSKKQKNEFGAKARKVLMNITKLRDFLLEHQKDYISPFSHVNLEVSGMTDKERDQIDTDAETYMRTCSFAINSLKGEVVQQKRSSQVVTHREAVLEMLGQYLKGKICSHVNLEVSGMTDKERDQIDTDAETYMRTCSFAINSLKGEVVQQKRSSQVVTHREAVLEMLGQYLKVVCKLYSQQRAIRVKRMVDKKRISRLQPDQKKVKKDAEQTAPCSSTVNVIDGTTKEFKKQTDPSLDLAPADDEELTPEEVQMFEMENQRLFTEMNSLVDEVRHIEGQVVEISQLQEIFSEKVLHQSTQIDRVYETAVGTTENVKGGNEQIREAIKNNASFRVWILFFLVMCSLSLLFLDWYSCTRKVTYVIVIFPSLSMSGRGWEGEPGRKWRRDNSTHPPPQFSYFAPDCCNNEHCTSTSLIFCCSSRLQPDQKKVKKDAEQTAPCSSTVNVIDGTTKEFKKQTDPALDLAPADDEELTPEEVQMFEMENQRLFTEMNSLVDEVRHIEGQVVEISQLQEIFSEKVLHQSTQIDRVYETAVGTTENVKGGNEQIREAIKNNASFRVWILFFLVMCSLSLLFLDWYS
ncbi:PREDICTED: syntaxin-18-like [Acropora digitifera]|uniref:syntaxin-18-like n=1 Tax=Acropora digitifera TaxID=70779 RepID=UPI00077A5072|nr:PREDICTED: syntaxin-18-like [Acropora digitifera]